MLDIHGKKKATLFDKFNSLFSPSGFKFRHNIVKDGLVVPSIDEIKLGEYCANLIIQNRTGGGFLALTKTAINAMDRALYLAGIPFDVYQTHVFKNPITFGNPAKLETFLTELFFVMKKNSSESDDHFAVAIFILRAIQEKYLDNVKGWRIAFCFGNPFSYDNILKLLRDKSLSESVKAPIHSYVNFLGFRHFEDEMDEHRECLGWAEDVFEELMNEHRSIFNDQFEPNSKDYLIDPKKWQLVEVDTECASELVMLRLIYNEWLPMALDEHLSRTCSSDPIKVNAVVLAKMDAYTRDISKHPFSSALKFCAMGSIIEVGHEFESQQVAAFNNYKHFYN